MNDVVVKGMVIIWVPIASLTDSPKRTRTLVLLLSPTLPTIICTPPFSSIPKSRTIPGAIPSFFRIQPCLAHKVACPEPGCSSKSLFLGAALSLVCHTIL
ncbi:MAG: hypothetical protein CM1200mP30_29620 [Pseudomonadota bacterium]|nr:MAG: hypothetical protein CM1200mP30_29620 [Pseudomonadota bacterium]